MSVTRPVRDYVVWLAVYYSL